MGEVIDIRDFIPHYNLEAMCMGCFDRWIATVACDIVLKTIECKQCGPGYVVDTGQFMPNHVSLNEGEDIVS